MHINPPSDIDNDADNDYDDSWFDLEHETPRKAHKPRNPGAWRNVEAWLEERRLQQALKEYYDD
ncbi:MAG TPA: hypothetical protein VFK96_01860 [Gammaproteobacteria bacterium]|nr:hypothetical protein [Gammaproteobacteria bacterium]